MQPCPREQRTPSKNGHIFLLSQKMRNVMFMRKKIRFFLYFRLTKFPFKFLVHKDFCEPDSEMLTSDTRKPFGLGIQSEILRKSSQELGGLGGWSLPNTQKMFEQFFLGIYFLFTKSLFILRIF